MKNKVKKLHLNKHTLTNLTNLELNQPLRNVKGGGTDFCGTNGCSQDGRTTCPSGLPETVC